MKKLFNFFLFCLFVRLRKFDFVSSRLSFIWIALKFQIIFISGERCRKSTWERLRLCFVFVQSDSLVKLEWKTRESLTRGWLDKDESAVLSMCVRETMKPSQNDRKHATISYLEIEEGKKRLIREILRLKDKFGWSVLRTTSFCFIFVIRPLTHRHGFSTTSSVC